MRMELTRAGLRACTDSSIGLSKPQFVSAAVDHVATIDQERLSASVAQFFGYGVEGINWQLNVHGWMTHADWGIGNVINWGAGMSNARRSEQLIQWRLQPRWLQPFVLGAQAPDGARAMSGLRFLVAGVQTVRGHAGSEQVGYVSADRELVWVPWPEVGAWFRVESKDIPRPSWLSAVRRLARDAEAAT